MIECSNDIDDIFDNIDEYSSNKKRKILIAFDDMIADMLSNKKPQSIVTRLFVKHFSCFYHIVLFAVWKNIRLNSTYYLIMKIPNKQEV